MPKTKLFLAISILVGTTLACNAFLPAAEPTPFIIVEPTSLSQPSNLPATEADVPRVELEKAFAAWAGGAAIFVDVRNADAYTLNHVSGAINLPLDLIEANPTGIGLEKDEWIVTYCT